MKNHLKESGDTFREIVRQYASLYRNSELSRLDKEQYFQWLQSNSDKLSPELRSRIEKKVQEKQLQKTEATTTSAVAGVMTPFAFSKKGPGNVRAAKQLGYKLVKPIKRSPNTLANENQMYSEPAYVTPAQNIEPVDTYEDEHGLIQHGDPELDPALAGKEQSALPMYEEKINKWFDKINNIIEGVSGLKYKLKTEADDSQSISGPQKSTSTPSQLPVQSQPQPQVVNYDVQSDFTSFDTRLKSSTEQLKLNFQKTIQNKILNKKVVIRASKGINQPESDYTVNVTGVNIDYFYDRYVIVIIGREENKRKTSKFLLKSGFRIKILGPADLKPRDKYQVAKSKALVGTDEKGSSNVVTSKEPPPTEPKTPTAPVEKPSAPAEPKPVSAPER